MPRLELDGNQAKLAIRLEPQPRQPAAAEKLIKEGAGIRLHGVYST